MPADADMGPRQLLVSVVIPAFNEAASLPRSIERIRSAFETSLPGAYEIIVCDNNSTDATAKVAEAAGCRVVFEPINQISRARNRGAAAASAEWLVFIDADTWPSYGLVGDLVPVLESPRYVGCGATVRVVDGPRWYRFAWQSQNWLIRTFKLCPGAFIVCRHEAFVEIGGFSTEHYIFEEVDFVRRLKALAASRRQRFVILHRHPFITSGRRAASYSPFGWLKFAARLMLSYRKAVRDRRFAEKWYDGER